MEGAFAPANEEEGIKTGRERREVKVLQQGKKGRGKGRTKILKYERY